MKRSRVTMAALCVAVLAAATGCERAPVPSPWRSALVSIDAAGTETGDGASFRPAFSPDGTRIAFASTSSDLSATPDSNGVSDIFVRDLLTGITTLVSTNAAGTQAADGRSDRPAFSPDGTHLMFVSAANDLGPVDANGTDDIYLRDLSTGDTELVSIGQSGDAGGSSGLPVFSPDGARIAFQGLSALVAADTNGSSDVYVRDLIAQTTVLVSADVTGSAAGDGWSRYPRFSPDGTKVAFLSRAGDLVGTDTNGAADIFLRDLAGGTTSLVSADRDGVDAGNGYSSSGFQFGPDGSTLYFTSIATNLVATDANGRADVFARDLAAGTTELLSLNAAGTASANGHSSFQDLSPDGRRLAFLSSADDLGPTDTNGITDLYLLDLATGSTSLVSRSAESDDAANGWTQGGSFSPDGQKLSFTSYASDLGPHDSDDAEGGPGEGFPDTWNLDVFVHDLASGTTTMVSTNEAGTDSANDNSDYPVFGPDGSRVAFVTTATDLGYTDLNEDLRTGSLEDVYIATFHGADLAVTLGADRTTVTEGETIAYDVALANDGPDPAEDTAVAVVLPDQADLVDVESAGATCTSPEPTRPDVLVCEAGTLAAGGGVTATIRVSAGGEPGASLAAVAIAASSTSDPDGTDNTASVDVLVE